MPPLARLDAHNVLAHTFYLLRDFPGRFEGAPVWVQMLKIHEDTFRRALKANVKIAFGTDAGGFAWTITPAKEFAYMVQWDASQGHAIIGVIVIALLFLQPLGGILHHRKYQRHGEPTLIGRTHRWIGRIFSVLGVINGGLGLWLAQEDNDFIIIA